MPVKAQHETHRTRRSAAAVGCGVALLAAASAAAVVVGWSFFSPIQIDARSGHTIFRMGAWDGATVSLGFSSATTPFGHYLTYRGPGGAYTVMWDYDPSGPRFTWGRRPNE